EERPDSKKGRAGGVVDTTASAKGGPQTKAGTDRGEPGQERAARGRGEQGAGRRGRGEGPTEAERAGGSQRERASRRG
ncbi:2-methylcitrate synthase, partial [Mycobacterium tuberculosis]